MATSQAIYEHASDHTQLLNAIAELDYVPSALSQQTEYLKDLEKRLNESRKKTDELAKKTKKERKEHEALRKSTVRRLAHKLTGQGEKFTAKEVKEEREFVEAMEQELVQKEQLDVVRRMRDEAKDVHAELSSKAGRYETLKDQLGDLYERIFDGPTAEFPEDDQLEYEFQMASQFYDEVQKTVNAESHAAELLTQAESYLKGCAQNVDEALSASQWDIYGARGADWIERSALSTAQSLAMHGETLVHQAQNVSPFVQPIGPLRIAQGSLIGDVFFDNIFTDIAFHQKIEETSVNVQQALRQLTRQRLAACSRAETAGSQLNQASRRLSNARSALWNFRKETFQMVANSDRPPNYEPDPPSPSEMSSQAPAPAFPIPNTTEPQPLSEPDEAATSLPASGTGAVSTGPSWGSRNPYAALLMRRASTPANAVAPEQTEGKGK